MKHGNTSTNEQVNQILREEYEALDNDGEISISAALLASKAWERIDPLSQSAELPSYLSILTLRQFARGILAEKVEADEQNDHPQDEMFTGHLQKRYPVKRNGEETYVLRECMTIPERRENAARLQREGATKIAHGRALDAETDMLIADGILAA